MPGRLANFVLFPYDWRLSNRASAVALKAPGRAGARTLPRPGRSADAKVVFIGHSMGGLVARYYVTCSAAHEVTSKVITLGTPHRGAVNALERSSTACRRVGPVKLDLTELSRSMPSLYQLLPEYACIESGEGLRKTTEVACPTSTRDVADAMRFHEELRRRRRGSPPAYDSHPIIARTQPTCDHGPLRGRSGRDVADDRGPRRGRRRHGAPALGDSVRRHTDDAIVRYMKDKHGALPANDSGAGRARRCAHRAGRDRPGRDYDVGVICDDIVVAGRPST